MTRPNVLNFRLSDEQLERLKADAESKQVSPAEVLPDYIAVAKEVFDKGKS